MATCREGGGRQRLEDRLAIYLKASSSLPDLGEVIARVNSTAPG